MKVVGEPSPPFREPEATCDLVVYGTVSRSLLSEYAVISGFTVLAWVVFTITAAREAGLGTLASIVLGSLPAFFLVAVFSRVFERLSIADGNLRLRCFFREYSFRREDIVAVRLTQLTSYSVAVVVSTRLARVPAVFFLMVGFSSWGWFRQCLARLENELKRFGVPLKK